MDTNPNATKIKFKSKKFAGTETDMAAEALAVKAAKEARAAAKKPAKAQADKKPARIEAPKPETPAPSKASAAKKSAKKPDKTEAPKLSKAEARLSAIPAPTVTVTGNIGPGVEIATELQQAFTHLNAKIFSNKVEPCVVVVSKLRRSYGHFWHSAFARRQDLKNKVHEIGIDFRRLAAEGHKNDIDVLSTIAHEMAHALVFQLDKADAAAKGAEFRPKTYHCATWAAVMNRIGLKPEALDKDGHPTGKETGPNATHEIVKGGPFETVAKELLATGFKFSWSVSDGYYDDNGRAVRVKVGKGGKIEVVEGSDSGTEEGEGEGKAKKKRAGAKAVHVCPHCQSKAWGKPSMVVMCRGTKAEPHDPTEMDCDRAEYEVTNSGEGGSDDE